MQVAAGFRVWGKVFRVQNSGIRKSGVNRQDATGLRVYGNGVVGLRFRDSALTCKFKVEVKQITQLLWFGCTCKQTFSCTRETTIVIPRSQILNPNPHSPLLPSTFSTRSPVLHKHTFKHTVFLLACKRTTCSRVLQLAPRVGSRPAGGCETWHVVCRLIVIGFKI